MGAFQSKASEESATKSDVIVRPGFEGPMVLYGFEGAMVQSVAKGPMVQSVNDGEGAIVRSEGKSEKKGSSKTIVADKDFDVFAEGVMKGFTVSTMLAGGGALVFVTVALQYICYADAKRTLKSSEYYIPRLQEKIQLRLQDRMRRGVIERGQDSILVRDLERWERRRESAAAYIKKHPITGKLVEIFPPEDD